MYSKRDMSPGAGKPKPTLFMPEVHPETGVLETSVCRMESFSDDSSWALADRLRTDKTSLGRADLSASQVDGTGLTSKSAPDHENNYPEHAVIVGWKPDKDMQKAVAANLVFHSKLIIRNGQ